MPWHPLQIIQQVLCLLNFLLWEVEEDVIEVEGEEDMVGGGFEVKASFGRWNLCWVEGTSSTWYSGVRGVCRVIYLPIRIDLTPSTETSHGYDTAWSWIWCDGARWELGFDPRPIERPVYSCKSPSLLVLLWNSQFIFWRRRPRRQHNEWMLNAEI